MERIRDKANAERYNRMIAKREEQIAEAKKQIEEKTEVVVNAASESKPEEAQVVESIQEEEPEVEPTLVEKYQAFKSTINMAEFNDLVDLVTADTKKMRQMMAESMQAIANDCGLKA